MMRRFLLVVQPQGDGLAALAERLAEVTGLETIHCEGRIAALASSNCGGHPLGEAGVIVGRLFRRHDRARPVPVLEEAEAGSIAAEGSARLLRAYWGGYVSALERCGSVRVLRDPSGALPCFHAEREGTHAFASDAALLLRCGFAGAELDWKAIGRHFLNAGLPVAETSLRDIDELLPGFEAELGARSAPQRPRWSPWDHVRADADNEAPAEVGRAVRQAVAGWAAAHGPLLVSVSGGLDSSIVAACLAGSGANATCLTMYGDDPEGDERLYARALCAFLGLDLHERREELDGSVLFDPVAAHLPRPSGRSQALSYERAHAAAALEIGAEAFMTGNGGDSVFGYSQSAAAVADRFLAEGLGIGLLRSLADVCHQTGCSAFQAIVAAARLALRPRAYRWRAERLFLHPHPEASLSTHPWLEAPAGALPGKAAHIAAILRVQTCLEPGRSSLCPVLHPLMAQPVLEACLAIPTWRWREGGRDRAVAREAFERALPEIIVRRRGKGGPDGFAASLLIRYREGIRDRLLGGALVARRIVDGEAVEAALGSERGPDPLQRVRLLELLAGEAWVEHWKGGAARASWGDPR